MDTADRRIVIGALVWSLGIFALSYGYRLVVTDPRFSPLEPIAHAPQVRPISQVSDD
jgi:hypothetical protein